MSKVMSAEMFKIDYNESLELLINEILNDEVPIDRLENKINELSKSTNTRKVINDVLTDNRIKEKISKEYVGKYGFRLLKYILNNNLYEGYSFSIDILNEFYYNQKEITDGFVRLYLSNLKDEITEDLLKFKDLKKGIISYILIGNDEMYKKLISDYKTRKIVEKHTFYTGYPDKLNKIIEISKLESGNYSNLIEKEDFEILVKKALKWNEPKTPLNICVDKRIIEIKGEIIYNDDKNILIKNEEEIFFNDQKVEFYGKIYTNEGCQRVFATKSNAYLLFEDGTLEEFIDFAIKDKNHIYVEKQEDGIYKVWELEKERINAELKFKDEIERSPNKIILCNYSYDWKLGDYSLKYIITKNPKQEKFRVIRYYKNKKRVIQKILGKENLDNYINIHC